MALAPAGLAVRRNGDPRRPGNGGSYPGRSACARQEIVELAASWARTTSASPDPCPAARPTSSAMSTCSSTSRRVHGLIALGGSTRTGASCCDGKSTSAPPSRRRTASVTECLPRHRQHPRGHDWREHSRAHGSDGPLHDGAALIYQHATKNRDAAIAAALSDLAEQGAAAGPPARVVRIAER